MMIKKYLLIMMTALGLFGIAMTGCDVGINPLLFDGSPVSCRFRVDASGTSYSGSATISLNNILSKIDKHVDSAKVFNITMLIDSVTGTPLVSGTGTIDGHTLLTPDQRLSLCLRQ